jgi:hypothetical protein
VGIQKTSANSEWRIEEMDFTYSCVTLAPLQTTPNQLCVHGSPPLLFQLDSCEGNCNAAYKFTRAVTAMPTEQKKTMSIKDLSPPMMAVATSPGSICNLTLQKKTTQIKKFNKDELSYVISL